ncbi:TonB-dependent receptor domain-containing protein [Parapedobacter deserti]|uniref:TonB-dependent receptor domain-containing protein n=1 Tax=Parapedobacter deserti TaxID=1912957 RepID=A0ABV7JM79_9SPHI
MDFMRGTLIGILVLWMIWALPLAVIGQGGNGSISATIVDNVSKEPVGFASAALLQQESKTYVSGMQTQDDGQIRFTDVPAGVYAIRVTFVGYEDLLREQVVVRAGQHVDLGKLSFIPSGELLDEVVVEGTRPAMEMGIDRKIFNVAQSTLSVGGTAADLLTNVPSLQVDMDGTVSLRGSSSVRILINGRESALAGSDVAQFLQSLPANSVDRVEVVTNPSSKYDAEGQSGIINIVLKRNTLVGFNGTANVSGGSYNNYMAGMNLNFRDTKANYYLGYTFNRRNMVGDGINDTEFIRTASMINNRSESGRLGLNHNVQLGLDYYVSDKTFLAFGGNISVRGNERDEDIFYRYINHPQFAGNSTRLSRQNEDDFGGEVFFDFRQGFRRDGEELTANLTYGYDTENGVNRFNQDYTQPPSGLYERERINDTEETGHNINIQLDYVRPFGDKGNHKFEAGYRTIVRRGLEHQYSEVDSTVGLLPDYRVSNDFDMTSSVHALYGNYQNKLTEKLGYQVGLRAEQAYLDTRLGLLTPGLSDEERTVPGRLDYFRIYPSVFLTQEFGNQNQLQLSYTRRVSRPRGWQVNPFIDISDNMNHRQGNPNLMPEDIHSFELGYTKTWTAVLLTASAYQRIVRDVTQPIISAVNETTGVTLMQWQNLGKSENTGFELISKIDITKKWDVMTNVNAFHTWFSGGEVLIGDQDMGISPNSGFSWNANATTNYRFTPQLSLQTRLEYQAPRIMAQGKGIENFVIDAGLRMDVLNRKGSIMFNARDLLNQRRFGGFTTSNGVHRYFEHRWMRRTFMLTFNYRFGNQQIKREERKRDKETESFGGEQQF